MQRVFDSTVKQAEDDLLHLNLCRDLKKQGNLEPSDLFSWKSLSLGEPENKHIWRSEGRPTIKRGS